MKILIVGGNSTLGKALSNQTKGNHNVITAGRSGCDIVLDLNSATGQMNIPHDIDIVIHTAAHFGGKTAVEMEAALDTNVLGTLRLLHASAKAGVKHFIFISSIFECLQNDSPFYTIYSVSKRHAEEVARLFCTTNDLALTVLRPTQIYGSTEEFRRHQPFLYMIIDNAFAGKDVNIYGSNDPERNYIHIDDLAQVIAKVAEQKISGTFACMHPENTSYAAIAKIAAEVFGTETKVNFLAEKDSVASNVFPVETSLYELIGFTPSISMTDGVKKIAKNRLAQL